MHVGLTGEKGSPVMGCLFLSQGVFKLQIFNQTQNVVLVENVKTAQTTIARMKGLLGKKHLEQEGLLIKPCKQIHSIGMRFPFDAVFLDGNDQVCHIHENMMPGEISKFVVKAKAVLEIPAGTVQKTNTCIGDLLIERRKAV